jgi:hypothetical protein
VKPVEGANMLDYYEGSEAPFSLFYKELVGFIFKASACVNSTSEEDYSQIVDAYTTPAERIIKLLIGLKSSSPVKDEP